jgi:hypothetical protein
MHLRVRRLERVNDRHDMHRVADGAHHHDADAVEARPLKPRHDRLATRGAHVAATTGRREKSCEPRFVEREVVACMPLADGPLEPGEVEREQLPRRRSAELHDIDVEQPRVDRFAARRGDKQDILHIEIRVQYALLCELRKQSNHGTLGERSGDGRSMTRQHRAEVPRIRHEARTHIDAPHAGAGGVERVGEHLGRENATRAQCCACRRFARCASGHEEAVTGERREEATVPRVPHRHDIAASGNRGDIDHAAALQRPRLRNGRGPLMQRAVRANALGQCIVQRDVGHQSRPAHRAGMPRWRINRRSATHGTPSGRGRDASTCTACTVMAAP